MCGESCGAALGIGLPGRVGIAHGAQARHTALLHPKLEPQAICHMPPGRPSMLASTYLQMGGGQLEAVSSRQGGAGTHVLPPQPAG